MLTKKTILLVLLLSSMLVKAQIPVKLTGYEKKKEGSATVKGNILEVVWPTGETNAGKINIDLKKGSPLINSLQLSQDGVFKEIASNLDPAFILTVGKRDLISQNGWNIFFDKTAYLPHKSYAVNLNKNSVEVKKSGSRVQIIISGAEAGEFTGDLEITLFDGSPLLNIAAVMSTQNDSTAIIYDAGLTSSVNDTWAQVLWADPENYLQAVKAEVKSESKDVAVKYRTIIGETKGGSIAVFPPPHQYFYPLDNAFNLKFTWYGANYRQLLPSYGIGIRQDLMGDRRWVPWFNAPPATHQRLNFFCLLSADKDGKVLEDVKKYTHNDTYKPLNGYYTMASHFHTEHIDDVLTHKPIPEMPGFVKVLRNTGVNIVHLGEFHLAGNPHDLGPRRLSEFKRMFEESKRLSEGNFLLLPGEEPNSHFGGHWMNIFPKPVYWIMSRKASEPFVEEMEGYGKVYRVGSKEDMLKLLEVENGLAWTAHARTKGSTGFPDRYKEENFFHSDRFLGAAWKSIPADLSQPRLGKRVLDLMDDMANWGHQKYVIGEADLFKLEPGYELYGHMNINYMQLDRLPKFEQGWQPILDVLENGRFFVSTGEVLLPQFTVNGKKSGETAQLDKNGKGKITLEIDWTFPLNFVEIISGDGQEVYRQKIDLRDTRAFGKQRFDFTADLKNRKWVRVEVWDAAVNGAFTQQVWLN